MKMKIVRIHEMIEALCEMTKRMAFIHHELEELIHNRIRTIIPQFVEYEEEPELSGGAFVHEMEELDIPIGSPTLKQTMTPEQAYAKLKLFTGKCADVREIIEAYVKANGYNGLVNQRRDCCCDVDNDGLMTCGIRCDKCQPAYYHKATTDHEAGWYTDKPEGK
ncbi:MAG: hypothetical protein ABFC94_15670 [Syntrophomonas sp.]